MLDAARDTGPDGTAAERRPVGVSELALASGFLVAYVALEGVSFLHEYEGVPITSWNPGLGVVFALMLARGARFAAVLFLGVVLAEIVVLRSVLPWPVKTIVGGDKRRRSPAGGDGSP